MFNTGKAQNDSLNLVSECHRFMDFRKLYDTELLSDYYPFINYASNVIMADQKAVLQRMYDAIQQAEKQKVRILHIGDSHIHSDIFTGYVRHRLQNIFGSGGRGLLFPYCTAGTHATRDYKTDCSGNWSSAKTTEKVQLYDIGLTGVTARTEDVNSTASIIFRGGGSLPKDQNVLISLLYLPSANAFDAVISSGEKLWKIQSNDIENGLLQGYIEWTSDTLIISFDRSDTSQTFFELYGLIVESDNHEGVIYHAAGINGTAIQHLSGQKLLEKHLSVLRPDLIILDLGTNDIYKGYFNELALEKIITTVLKRIRLILPDVNILLMTPQDMYYRKKHVVKTEELAELLKRIAYTQNCAFYNFFEISGNNHSILQWEKQGLAKKDRIHLTTEGYELKGKLFVIALLDMIHRHQIYERNSKLEPFPLIDTACISQWFVDPDQYKPEILSESEVQVRTELNQENMHMDVHIVKSGENLGMIANKYGITVHQIQQKNNLQITKIYPGQKLIIGNNQKPTTNSRSGKETGQNAQVKTIYSVKTGDSLYKIANTYGVSVKQIKTWNSLSSDIIYPGQKLEIFK